MMEVWHETASPSNAPAAAATDAKDWARECYHLHQHLHFATQYIM